MYIFEKHIYRTCAPTVPVPIDWLTYLISEVQVYVRYWFCLLYTSDAADEDSSV